VEGVKTSSIIAKILSVQMYDGVRCAVVMTVARAFLPAHECVVGVFDEVWFVVART